MAISDSEIRRKGLDDISNIFMGALFEITDGVVITDKSGTIKWVNQAYENLTGYLFEELIDNNPRILKSEKHDDVFYKDFWDTIKSGNVWKGEVWNKRKDGTLFLTEQTTTPVKDEESCITHYFSINRNITNKARINEQLNNALRIEAIGQLTAGVAHNFNNKLASILGFADLALEETKKYGNSDLDDSINEIITAGKFSRDLVKQMMAFSITTPSEPKPIDIHLAVQQAVKTLRSTLPTEVHISMILNEVPLIIFDPIRLHQMLISLAVNSNEAMNKKGQLTFAVGTTTLNKQNCNSCHEIISGDYIFVSVTDTGQGILEEDIKDIFMPFFTTRQNEGGTGMGLSALHGMLHDMRGHVVVDSVVGEYTQFQLLFPNNKVESESRTINNESNQYKVKKLINENPHILIVDDELSVANFVSEILILKGYQVTKETDSCKALQTFSDNPDKYDILITDQSMPFLSGTELVKCIYEIRQDLSTILMTGYGESEFKSNHEYIDAVLIKPFETKALLDIIKQLLEKYS